VEEVLDKLKTSKAFISSIIPFIFSHGWIVFARQSVRPLFQTTRRVLRIFLAI